MSVVWPSGIPLGHVGLWPSGILGHTSYSVLSPVSAEMGDHCAGILS